MMMLEDPTVAWGCYLLGAVGLFAVWWRMTRGIGWSTLRRVLRSVMFVLLLCPFSIGDGYHDLAPAVLMVAMETVFEGVEQFQRVGPFLLWALLLAAVAALVFDAASRFWRYRHPAKPSATGVPQDSAAD